MSTLYGSCSILKMTPGVGDMRTSLQLVTIIPIISAICVNCLMVSISNMDVAHALPLVLSPNITPSTGFVSAEEEAKFDRLRSKYNQECNDSQKDTRCSTWERKISNFIKGLFGAVLPHGDLRSGEVTRRDLVCLAYNPVALRWYRPTEQICCNGLHNRTTATQQCCFGNVYDTADSLCCGRDVKPRRNASEQIACCNDEVLYDPTSKLCCNGALYDVTSEVGCCSDVTYNKSSETCCNGTVQPTFGTYNRHGRCCGDRNYNMQCYKCNRNNAVVPHFDTVNALCCKGNVILKLGTNSECCGRLVLDPDVSVCRNGSIQRKKGTKTDTPVRYGPTELPGAGPINTTFTQDNEDASHLVPKVAGLCAVVFVAIAAIGIVCRLKNKNNCRTKGHWSFNNIRSFSNVLNRSFLSIPSMPTINYAAASVPSDLHVAADRHDEDTVYVVLNNTHNEEEEVEEDEEDQQHQQHPQQQQQQELIPVGQNNTYQCDQRQQTKTQQQISHNGKINTQQQQQQTERLPDRQIPDIQALMKESSSYKGNMVADYITETGTQTCIRKECNRRNVFGEPYEFNYILDSSNSTFEMEASSTKLVLPAKLLRNAEVETHGSTFRSIPAVMAKFGISHDNKIASPAVEYFLTGYPELPDHAVCVLPFIGRREDLRVWKFQSDEGMHETIASQTVSEKEKENADTDMYYIVKDRYVYIYTKSFSGFYCTTCGRRELSLQAYVFGSYKKIQDFEIRLVVYIADEILKFKDYSKRMYDNEYNQGRVQKIDQPINLLPELTENDILRFRISPTGVHREGWWEHKPHPDDNRPIKAAEQEIPLSWVAKCHGLSETPYFVEWYLICPRDDPDFTFQCIVDVDCQKHDNSARVNTRLVVDELRLRRLDLLGYPGQGEDNQVRLQDIKYELFRLDDDRRGCLAARLSHQVPLSREMDNLSVVLDKLQNCCNRNGFLKTIASALLSLRYYDVLDRLCEIRLIPPDYAGLSVQPVTRDAMALPMATCSGAMAASRQGAGACCDEQSSESDSLLQSSAQLNGRQLQAPTPLIEGQLQAPTPLFERQLQAPTPLTVPVLPLPTPATERPLQAYVSLNDQTVQASVPSFTRQSQAHEVQFQASSQQPGGDDQIRLGDGSGGCHGREREYTIHQRTEQQENKVPVRPAARNKLEKNLNRGDNLQRCRLTSSKTEPDTIRLDNRTLATLMPGLGSNLLDKPLRQELAEKESRHLQSQHGHDGVNEHLIPNFPPELPTRNCGGLETPVNQPNRHAGRDLESPTFTDFSDINELPVQEEAASSLTEIKQKFESSDDRDGDDLCDGRVDETLLHRLTDM